MNMTANSLDLAGECSIDNTGSDESSEAKAKQFASTHVNNMVGTKVLELDMMQKGLERAQNTQITCRDAPELLPALKSYSEFNTSQFMNSSRHGEGYNPKKALPVVGDRLFFRKNDSKVEHRVE